jgi:hypothetical protein
MFSHHQIYRTLVTERRQELAVDAATVHGACTVRRPGVRQRWRPSRRSAAGL